MSQSAPKILALLAVAMAIPCFAENIAISPSSGTLSFTTATPGFTGTETISPTSGLAFTITGQANQAYRISVNGSTTTYPTVSMKNGASTITMVPSTQPAIGSNGLLDGTGKQTLYVGGTRNSIPGAAVANLHSGTFTVSVRYTSGGATRTSTVTSRIDIFRLLTISATRGLSFSVAAPGDPAEVVSAASSQSASFDVKGESNASFNITLPSAPVTLKNAGGDSISVSSFTSSPTSPGQLSSADPGVKTINVGATRNALPTNTKAGNYSGSFNVSVQYP